MHVEYLCLKLFIIKWLLKLFHYKFVIVSKGLYFSSKSVHRFSFSHIFCLEGTIPGSTCTDFYFSHIFLSEVFQKKWEHSQNFGSWEDRLTQKILVSANLVVFICEKDIIY